MLDLVDLEKSGHSTGKAEGSAQAEGNERPKQEEDDGKKLHWLKFKQ